MDRTTENVLHQSIQEYSEYIESEPIVKKQYYSTKDKQKIKNQFLLSAEISRMDYHMDFNESFS